MKFGVIRIKVEYILYILCKKELSEFVEIQIIGLIQGQYFTSLKLYAYPIWSISTAWSLCIRCSIIHYQTICWFTSKKCTIDVNAHRYGETKNVRINHPVKGLVHPSCTGNETGYTLVWTVLSYGAEAWTPKIHDERKISPTEGCWMDRKD